MPTLEQSLKGKDLGHYKIVADLWRIDFSAPDAKAGFDLLISSLPDKHRLREVVESLPQNAKQALSDLIQNGGSLPAAHFWRRYGEIREVGSGRRDREKPYLDSQVSTSEILWYRAFIGTTTLDKPDGIEEFVYVPDDLVGLISLESQTENTHISGRYAASGEKAFVELANTTILDDTCTMLAGLRNGLSLEAIQPHLAGMNAYRYPLKSREIIAFLFAAELIDKRSTPRSEAVRKFLELKDAEALVFLFSKWVKSSEFNELKLLPDLEPQGTWKNDPQAARQKILGFISSLRTTARLSPNEPERLFWSLQAFVAGVREQTPDFQRSAGDYDSWYLLDRRRGKFLRGFENWDLIDGELIRYIICGPLHWLGFLDLGYPAETSNIEPLPPSSFRSSAWAGDLVNLIPPATLRQVPARPAAVRSDGSIIISKGASRSARYLIARFCDWEGLKHEEYRYRLSPKSLKRANLQGLKIQHLINILNMSQASISPKLIYALNDWETNGIAVKMQKVVVLRLKDPELLVKIRNSKVNRFLGEPLGPTAIIVRDNAWKKVVDAISEMGFLADIQFEDEELHATEKKTPE